MTYKWKTIVHFHYWPKSFKARSLNHFGFFDPDPVLLAQLFNSLLRQPAWQRAQDQDQKIPKWFEDHASKLRFFKFLASNQNGRGLVKESSIVGPLLSYYIYCWDDPLGFPLVFHPPCPCIHKAAFLFWNSFIQKIFMKVVCVVSFSLFIICYLFFWPTNI